MVKRKNIGLGHLRQSLNNQRLRLKKRFEEDLEAIDKQLYIIEQMEEKPVNLSGGGWEFMVSELDFVREKIKECKDWLKFVDGRRSAIEFKDGVKISRREYIKYIEDKL